jgi:hypothetical protein
VEKNRWGQFPPPETVDAVKCENYGWAIDAAMRRESSCRLLAQDECAIKILRALGKASDGDLALLIPKSSNRTNRIGERLCIAAISKTRGKLKNAAPCRTVGRSLHCASDTRSVPAMEITRTLILFQVGRPEADNQRVRFEERRADEDFSRSIARVRQGSDSIADHSFLNDFVTAA